MSKKDKNKKQKKTKVTYIDDGRTIADMSSLGGGKRQSSGQSLGSSGKNRFSDCANTYFSAMRMMIKPMFITLGILALTFFLIWLLLTLSTML